MKQKLFGMIVVATVFLGLSLFGLSGCSLLQKTAEIDRDLVNHKAMQLNTVLTPSLDLPGTKVHQSQQASSSGVCTACAH